MATQVLQFNQAQQAVLNVINALNGRTFFMPDCKSGRTPDGGPERWSRKQEGGPETRNDILHPIANNKANNH